MGWIEIWILNEKSSICSDQFQRERIEGNIFDYTLESLTRH